MILFIGVHFFKRGTERNQNVCITCKSTTFIAIYENSNQILETDQKIVYSICPYKRNWMYNMH